ncbi:MAG: hypothetical protein WEC73_01440 [Chthoniobacterales bacterium]
MNELHPAPVYWIMRQPLALFFTSLLLTAPAGASMLKELNPGDRDKLESGQSVLVTIEKPGAIWPEVRIYRKVKATPEGVTDLFLDYENADSFIHNLDSAVVEKQPDGNTKDVRYTVRLPVLFTISYLVRNRYEKTPGGYTVHWNLLESFFAKSAVGNLRVEPHGETAIICYANHVEPATKLVAGLRGQALKEASNTVDAIVKEAERRHAVGAKL